MNHFWRDIPGYFTFPDYYRHVAINASGSWRGVEVGVYTGQSAAFLLVELDNAWTEARTRTWLDLVDSRLTEHSAIRNLAPVAHMIGSTHECDSVEASRRYDDASVDFVFIDADHSYAAVKRDIDAWLPKVKPGGIIAGHDHCPDFPGVERAVQETFPRYEVWRGSRGPGFGDKRMIDTGLYYSVWSVRV